MKSRISIEIDFDNGNQPIIQILKGNSDDVRDKLVSSFTEQVGGSSWLQIKWLPVNDYHVQNGFQIIHISPIRPDDLKDQSIIMLEQYELHKSYQIPSNG